MEIALVEIGPSRFRCILLSYDSLLTTGEQLLRL